MESTSLLQISRMGSLPMDPSPAAPNQSLATRANSTLVDPTTVLNYDAMLLILELLRAKDICRLRCVNKTWRRLAYDKSLCRSLVAQFFSTNDWCKQMHELDHYIPGTIQAFLDGRPNRNLLLRPHFLLRLINRVDLASIEEFYEHAKNSMRAIQLNEELSLELDIGRRYKITVEASIRKYRYLQCFTYRDPIYEIKHNTKKNFFLAYIPWQETAPDFNINPFPRFARDGIKNSKRYQKIVGYFSVFGPWKAICTGKPYVEPHFLSLVKESVVAIRAAFYERLNTFRDEYYAGLTKSLFGGLE